VSTVVPTLPNRPALRLRLAAALLALAVLAACGTRLPDEAFEQSGQVITEEGEAGDGGTSADGGTEGTADTTGTAGSGGEGSGGGSGTGPGSGGDSGGPNQASDVGITATTIRIGNITAERGVLGDAFAPAVRGLRAWVGAINATGGIAGRKVELKTCDDREDRTRALECARRLVEQEKVFALLATNTRALGGASQYLADKQVPVIGIPITNAFYRYPSFYSVYGDGYAKDGKTVGYKNQLMLFTGGYRWFKSTLGVTKAAVFAYDIDESKQAGDFIEKGLRLEGFQVTRYTVSFAAPNFSTPVADMQQKGVQIVFDAMDDGANRRLCDDMERRDFTVKAKVSTIVSQGDTVGDRYNATCRNSVYITGDSRPYTQTAVPSIKAFRDAYKRYQPGQPLHQWALEAWAIGTMFRDVMKGMGPAPTRKGLTAALDKLNGYQAEGVMTGTSYVPYDYSKPRGQDCFTVARWQDSKGGWVEATNKFPFCYPDAHLYGTPVSEQGN
jgi:branched-chain amino acid transport system substrate-binding protein